MRPLGRCQAGALELFTAKGKKLEISGMEWSHAEYLPAMEKEINALVVQMKNEKVRGGIPVGVVIVAKAVVAARCCC